MKGWIDHPYELERTAVVNVGALTQRPRSTIYGFAGT